MLWIKLFSFVSAWIKNIHIVNQSVQLLQAIVYEGGWCLSEKSGWKGTLWETRTLILLWKKCECKKDEFSNPEWYEMKIWNSYNNMCIEGPFQPFKYFIVGVVKVNKMWIFQEKKYEWKMFSDLFWNLEDFPRSWEQPLWKDCTRSAAAVTTFNSCVKTTCYCFPPPPPPCPRSRPSTAEANIIPKHFQTRLPSYDREIPSKSKIVEQQQTNPSVQNISYKCFHRTSALEVLVATESVWCCFLTPSWQKMG